MFKLVFLYWLVLVFKDTIFSTSRVSAIPLLPCCRTNTTCRGTGHDNHFDVECGLGYAIAIYNITVGTKRMSTGCPNAWTTPVNDSSCCETNEEDCIFLFDSNANQIYHNKINGNEVISGLPVTGSNTPASCQGGTNIYYNLTNYMYINYNCINRTHIFDMFSDTGVKVVVEAEAVYIWSKDYPSVIQGDMDRAACSIEIDNCDAGIEMFTLDISLYSYSNGSCEQYLKIMNADNNTVNDWSCSENTVDVVSAIVPNYVIIYFSKNNKDVGGRFWIGFQPTTSSNITVNCPPEYPTMCERTTTSTLSSTTTTISSSSESLNYSTSTNSPPAVISTSQTITTDSNYDWVPIVIGVFAGLIFIVIVILITLYSRNFGVCQRRKQVKKEIIRGDANNGGNKNKPLQTAEIISEVENKKAADSNPVLWPNKTTKTRHNHEAKSTRTAHDKIDESVATNKKVKSSKKSKIQPDGKRIGEKVVSTSGKKVKSSPRSATTNSSQNILDVNNKRTHQRNNDHVIQDGENWKGENTVTADEKKENLPRLSSRATMDSSKGKAFLHNKKTGQLNETQIFKGDSHDQNPNTNTEPLSTTVASEILPGNSLLIVKNDINMIPKEKRAPASPIRNETAFNVGGSRPESATKSYRRKKRSSLHRNHLRYKNTPTTNQERSYPRPYHDSYSSEFESVDENDDDDDIKPLGHENRHLHKVKDAFLVSKNTKVSQRSGHKKKRRNKISPTHLSLKHRHHAQLKSKPFSLLDTDIKVLLGIIDNYDENRYSTMVNNSQGLTRSEAMNDLSRKSRRKRSVNANGSTDKNKELVENDAYNDITDVENKDDSLRIVKPTTCRSPQMAQTESLKTTLEAVLNSSKLNLKSKKKQNNTQKGKH
ncbi:uncharacterized protein LOC132758675 [Ruditapes philippinarum]|uniref:uncharacterized protein LOC132758675 n=1 Tax=Ruditapes philippinarum TaxID=129788 RepID=UPI00295BDDBD|nr:uncharacterized protein LOC132758675 [Ruditapes philippinarum]